MDRKQFQSCLKLIVLTSFLIFFVTSFQRLFSKDDSFRTLKKLRLAVLKENSIGKDFEYDLVGQKTCNKTKLTYLGLITTCKNKKYKLLNSFYVSGYSCRGINRLVIYDTNNLYLGNYKFEGSLPNALKNDKIVFKKGNTTCNKGKELTISFKNGLPNRFNICGEVIEFQSNE